MFALAAKAARVGSAASPLARLAPLYSWGASGPGLRGLVKKKKKNLKRKKTGGNAKKNTHKSPVG